MENIESLYGIKGRLITQIEFLTSDLNLVNQKISETLKILSSIPPPPPAPKNPIPEPDKISVNGEKEPEK